jgi:hypothetical protein
LQRSQDQNILCNMALKIHINNAKSTYTPGDQISGVVTFTGSRPINVNEVLISLKAISRCRFGLPEMNSLYSADIILHEQAVQLVEGPVTLQEAQSWPFKFLINDRTGYHKTPFQEPSRLYNDSPDQRIPPTFTVPKKDTASAEDFVDISLGLYTSINNGKTKSNLFKKDEFNDSIMLNFQPQRESLDHNWDMTTRRCNFEARTPLLTATNGEASRSLSIKERVMTTLKSSSLPSVTFFLLMSMPQAAIIGQPIPLFIGVQHDKARNSAKENPLVKLTSLNVKLITLTGLRGLVENYHGDKYQPASHSSWTRKRELATLNSPIQLSDIMDLREVLDLKVPEDCVQSFSTFNVARAYTLRISATVECARQKFDTKFEIYPLELLPGHEQDKNSPPGIARNPSMNPADINIDTLPTWEESGGYGNMDIPDDEKEQIPEPPAYA